VADVTFREAQIERYSRHILLKEVGGVGQQKLLDACVLVVGSNEALGVAVAYLAAGGTQIVSPEVFSGFLFGTSLARFNEDSVPTRAPTFALVAAQEHVPAEVSSWMCVGDDFLEWRIFGADACPVKLFASLSSATLRGSLAALVMQRIFLGLEVDSGRVEVG
jgi:hypothetical protein